MQKQYFKSHHPLKLFVKKIKHTNKTLDFTKIKDDIQNVRWNCAIRK